MTFLVRCFPPRRHLGHGFQFRINHRQTIASSFSPPNPKLDLQVINQLRANQTRMMDELHATCRWGTGSRWGSLETETGMSRLSLSDADKEARDWFVDTTRSLGCSVSVDAMGNTFAVRPGRNRAPPTCVGSHLDTQPSGGRYDGILGVLAGVEMLRVLEENRIVTEFPVGVINWTNEEGARFPISMMASGVWAGEISLEEAHNIREVGGGNATVKSELERIGYLGSMPASFEAMPLAAHFELHIEQGPILESEKQKIGIVEGVQAYRWYTVEVVGQGESVNFLAVFFSPSNHHLTRHARGTHRYHPLQRPSRRPPRRGANDIPLPRRCHQPRRARIHRHPYPLPGQCEHDPRPSPILSRH